MIMVFNQRLSTNASLFLSLTFLSATASAGYTSAWVDGPAPAVYERTADAMRVYVDLPAYGGHAVHTLESSAPTTGLGSHVGTASTATTPRISSNVKIPVGNTAGSSITSKITAVIPKSAIAKTAVAATRALPAVNLVLTAAWLVNAGIQYLSASDSFTQSPQTTTATCPTSAYTNVIYNPTLSGGTLFRPGIVVGGSWNCPTTPGNYIGVCGTSNINGVFTGICKNTGVSTPPQTAITFTQAETALANAPVSGTADTASGLDGIIKEHYLNGYTPQTDGNSPILTGDTTPVQGPQSTTVMPAGDTITNNTTYNPIYNNTDNSVKIGEVTTSTTTHPDGTTETSTITKSADTPIAAEQPQTDCDKYPNSIGCSEYGTIPTAEILPVTNAPMTFSYSTWGAGSCPSPANLPKGMTFDYTPMCNSLTQMKPIVLAFGLLVSLFIVFGAVRD